jgi:hypothetical protein
MVDLCLRKWASVSKFFRAWSLALAASGLAPWTCDVAGVKLEMSLWAFSEMKGLLRLLLLLRFVVLAAGFCQCSEGSCLDVEAPECRVVVRVCGVLREHAEDLSFAEFGE